MEKDLSESKEGNLYFSEYEYIHTYDEDVEKYEFVETGISFYDEQNNLLSRHKFDSPEETRITMKKVIAVCDLGEEEITKFNKVRHIIKGFLEICFRKKISVFLLSVAFIYMNIMGIKEKFYIMNIIYTWGLFKITEISKAVRFIKETLEEYKLREEALSDEDFMEFFETALTDEVDDMKLYLMLSNTKEKRL